MRLPTFGAWALFIVSLICAGIGMSSIAAAARKIIYGQIPLFNFGFWQLALTS